MLACRLAIEAGDEGVEAVEGAVMDGDGAGLVSLVLDRDFAAK